MATGFFQASLIFVGKASTQQIKDFCNCRNWRQCVKHYTAQATLKCLSLRMAPGLTQKHLTRLEMLAWDKHCGLLEKFVIYGPKIFMRQTRGANVINLFTDVIDKCLK